jgi:hypothetical protein
MRRLIVLTAVMAFFGCAPCAAQQGAFGPAPTPPGSGTTSPLGAIVTTSPVGGAGIDLGLSSLYVAGLSPLVTPTSLGGGAGCPDAMTSVSTPAPTSYDGETTGPTGVAPMSPGCGATTIGGVDLAAGLSSVPGSFAVTSSALTYLGAGVVPLGATNLGVAGLGPPFDAQTLPGSSAITDASSTYLGAPVVPPGGANLSAGGTSQPPVAQAPTCLALGGLLTSSSSVYLIRGGLVTLLSLGC